MFPASAAEDDDADEEQQNDDSCPGADGGDHVQRERRCGVESHDRRNVAFLVGDEAFVFAKVGRVESSQRRRRKEARRHELTVRDRVALE